MPAVVRRGNSPTAILFMMIAPPVRLRAVTLRRTRVYSMLHAWNGLLSDIEDGEKKRDDDIEEGVTHRRKIVY